MAHHHGEIKLYSLEYCIILILLPTKSRDDVHVMSVNLDNRGLFFVVALCSESTDLKWNSTFTDSRVAKD